MGIVEDKSFTFAVDAVNITKKLQQTQKEYNLTGQFVRSATSIGANASEAKYAQSRKDFISKMTIALKEANETKYWIRLMIATGYLDKEDGEKLLNDVHEIVRILSSIVKTTTENNI